MSEELISFAQEAKEEICRAERSDEAKRSLLASFIKINGHVVISNGKETLELVSENAKIAQLVYSYVHEIYGVNVRFAYTRSAGFSRRVNYHVIILEESANIIDDLEIDFLEGKIAKNAVASGELSAAYLAGGFLASGSVNSPSSSNYHLEIALADESYARWFSRLWNRVQAHQFDSKVVKRRNQFVCYLKRSDEISDFLVLVGAAESCLKFENVRVDRDFANIGNRLRNLDTANFGKTMRASGRQLGEIAFYLGKVGGIDRIDNPKLKALMKLRLQKEDATLDELSKELSDEFASAISKSNVNHLFRWLDEECRKAGYEG